MAIRKILINNTTSIMQILNLDVDPSGSFEVPYHLWLELASDELTIARINTGEILVNDGTTNLSSVLGVKLLGLFQEENIANIFDENNVLTSYNGRVLINSRGNLIIRRVQ